MRCFLRPSPRNHIPERVVRHIQQFLECPRFLFIELRVMLIDKTSQHDVQLQQPAAAAPAHSLKIFRDDIHTVRLTIRSLMLPMASVGFNSLGHTSTQFMMVWQRNNR